MLTEKLFTSAGVVCAGIFDLVAGAYISRPESPLPESAVAASAAIVLTAVTIFLRVRAERDFDFG